MPQAQKMWSFQFPGYAFGSDGTNRVSYVGNVVVDQVLPAILAAQTGTMTNKTDADTGVITLLSGHGIETADVVDVYFPAGVRYGMDATVAANAVTVDGGAGDDLPANAVACTVVLQADVEVNFDGDDAQIVGIIYRNPSDVSAKAHLDLLDVGDASIEEIDLVHEKANGADNAIYDIANGDANVFSGNRITQGKVTHDSVFAGTLYILVGITAA
jgi:hypothetical protein